MFNFGFSRKFLPRFVLISIIAVLFFQCGTFLENRKLNGLNEKYIGQYCSFFPVEATLMGVHSFDDRIDDYSLDSIRKIQSFFQENLNILAEIDTTKLSAGNRANYIALTYRIHEKKSIFQDWKLWQTEANFYSDVLENIVRGVNLHVLDSTTAYVVTMFSRIQDIPVFLNQARENLRDSTVKNIEFAIEQTQSVENYFSSNFIDKLDISTVEKDSLSLILATTLDSLQSFRAFLDKKRALPDNSRPTLSGDKYETYMQMVLNTPVTLDSLKNLLNEQLERYSSEMYKAGKTFFLNNTKSRNAPTGNALIDFMENEIETDALKKNEIIPFCTLTIEHLKRFIDEIWNLPLPLDYNVELVWSNDNIGDPMNLAHFESSGLFEKSPHLFCIMNPIENSQDWIRQLADLRKYNRASLTVSMMLEANLSHYQFWNTQRKQIPVVVQAFPDQVFLKGWPYFLAFKLIESGFGGYDAMLQFVLTKKFVKTLYILQQEIELFKGEISEKDFESHLVETGLFDLEEAHFARQKSMNYPTRAAKVFWGVYQFNKLEDSYRQNLGRDFTFNEFVNKMLRFGPASLAHLNQIAIEEFNSFKDKK